MGERDEFLRQRDAFVQEQLARRESDETKELRATIVALEQRVRESDEARRREFELREETIAQLAAAEREAAALRAHHALIVSAARKYIDGDCTLDAFEAALEDAYDEVTPVSALIEAGRAAFDYYAGEIDMTDFRAACAAIIEKEKGDG